MSGPVSAAIGPYNVFNGIIGHARIMGLLAAEVQQPSHAYFFVGPVGVGKATVARQFAAALLCAEGGRHDTPCSSCRRAGSGNHPDLNVVEPEGKTSMGVDQARTTVAIASMTPVEGDRKVVLFDDAGSMTDQAANALLKTIEEPTRTTVFILVAEAEDDLPPTIASRCRTVQFGRVRDLDLVEGLVAAGVDEAQATEACRIAGGRPGLALALATEPAVAAYRELWLAVPERVTPLPGDAFRMAEEVIAAAKPLIESVDHARASDEETKAGRERRERDVKRASQALMITGLEILASWYTDAAVAQFGGPVRNADVSGATLALVSPARAVASADLVLDAVTAIRSNQRPTLVLAELFTNLGADA